MNDFKSIMFSMKGRISRKTYWIYGAPYGLLWFLLLMTIGGPSAPTAVSLLLLVMVYPSMALNTKRFHDTGRSGYNHVWMLIPIVNFWYCFVLCFMKGEDGDNGYGSPER